MKQLTDFKVSQIATWTLADCADILDAAQASLAKVTEDRVHSVTTPLRESNFALNEFYGLQAALREALLASSLADAAIGRTEALFREFREKAIAEARAKREAAAS